MARPDTAWFYYYWPFYWHSKTQIVPGWDDTGPVDNPTTPITPCDLCPDGYTCVNDECVKNWEPNKKPNILPPWQATVDTPCRIYSSSGSWISITASWVYSWADANSWWQWTFKCEDSITFYWRLNASASSWLVNDIRWWVGNHVRSFVVPEWSIDEQSIFRFYEHKNWDYRIEIKRKNVWSTYYDWQIYEQWHLSEADWETLYVWVSALAQIWYIVAEDDSVIIYNWPNWSIKHNIHDWDITIASTLSWESITFMDKNLWASEYWTGSSSYGNEYWWRDIAEWNVPVPDWYHIPSLEELQTMLRLYQETKWVSTIVEEDFVNDLLLPLSFYSDYIWAQYWMYGSTSFYNSDWWYLQMYDWWVSAWYYVIQEQDPNLRLFKNN